MNYLHQLTRLHTDKNRTCWPDVIAFRIIIPEGHTIAEAAHIRHWADRASYGYKLLVNLSRELKKYGAYPSAALQGALRLKGTLSCQ
jgi:hypothetical protein